MDELKNLEQAKNTFVTICRALDKHGWRYKKDEEKLSIECAFQGDDLPMEINVNVDTDRMLVLLISHIPFVIQEDKRLDMALVVSAVNYLLIDGCFDYDISSGNLFFRMTNSFVESKIGEEAFAYMLLCSCQTIDAFNDKFLMLSKGLISVEQLISDLKN